MPAQAAMPRIYTHEEKVALVTKVEQMLGAGLGKTAAAQAAGTNWSSYTNWVRAGIRPARRPDPVKRSPEEKLRLVAAVQERMAEGVTALVACREVGIHREQFFHWRKRFAPPAAMRPVEVVGGDITALVPAPVTALVPAATTAITTADTAPEPVAPVHARPFTS